MLNIHTPEFKWCKRLQWWHEFKKSITKDLQTWKLSISFNGNHQWNIVLFKCEIDEDIEHWMVDNETFDLLFRFAAHVIWKLETVSLRPKWVSQWKLTVQQLQERSRNCVNVRVLLFRIMLSRYYLSYAAALSAGSILQVKFSLVWTTEINSIFDARQIEKKTILSILITIIIHFRRSISKYITLITRWFFLR